MKNHAYSREMQLKKTCVFKVLVLCLTVIVEMQLKRNTGI